jgi:hypothetical protein
MRSLVRVSLPLFTYCLLIVNGVFACEPHAVAQSKQVICHCTGAKTTAVVCVGTIDSNWCTSAVDWVDCDANGACQIGWAEDGCVAARKKVAFIAPDRLQFPPASGNGCGGISVQEWFASRNQTKAASRGDSHVSRIGN